MTTATATLNKEQAVERLWELRRAALDFMAAHERAGEAIDALIGAGWHPEGWLSYASGSPDDVLRLLLKDLDATIFAAGDIQKWWWYWLRVSRDQDDLVGALRTAAEDFPQFDPDAFVAVDQQYRDQIDRLRAEGPGAVREAQA